jgi:hypothetical protein
MPVTYEWTGEWQRLRTAVALLTWRRTGAGAAAGPRWLHDHALAMGALHTPREGGRAAAGGLVRVVERTATLPPPGARGTFRLEVRAIDRATGTVVGVDAPPVRVAIDPGAPTRPAPPLDLVTQLRELAAGLPGGPPALPRIFEEIARIGQYDPDQDHTAVAEVALAQRLREDDDRQWAYALALAQVLRRRVEPALATLERLVAQDPGDRAARGYLAFVALADLSPRRAERVLAPLRDDPAAPAEIHALRGAALLMQGRALRGWREIQAYRERAGGAPGTR